MKNSIYRHYIVGFFQNITCWSELPEKVWLRVLEKLPVKDVNSVHLVCRNLHQIANLHVNPKLGFVENWPKDLEALAQSSRIFEELEITKKCGEHLLIPEKFQVLVDMQTPSLLKSDV